MEYKNNDAMIAALVEYIELQGEEDALAPLIPFAQHYFSVEAFDALEHRLIADLYGAVLSHWNAVLSYKQQTESVNIYNPSIEEDGWQSTHTVIEIVIRDMPFILQSITMEINRHGFANQLLLNSLYWIKRDAEGVLLAISLTEQPDYQCECVVHIEIERIADASILQSLSDDLHKILGDIAAVTDDWQACLQVMQSAIVDLSTENTPELTESRAFLEWLQQNHFVFLGYREYQVIEQADEFGFSVVEQSGLGILRDSLASIPDNNFLAMTDDAYIALNNNQPLMITKATSKSTVHRPVFMDYIGIKKYDSVGKVIGEKRFLGLYASSAYSSELDSIPLVRHKIQHLMSDYQSPEYSQGERSLLYILNSLPRDEIFQASLEDLSRCALGVLALQARQQVRVFVRHEVYGHFVSILVFVPRERYHTESRKKIEAILLATFQGSDVDFSVKLTESILARIHFIIHSEEGCCVDYKIKEIEQQIVEALANWDDELADELHLSLGEAKANTLLQAYREGFSAAYREAVSARTAILDLKRFEQLQKEALNVLGVLYSPLSVNEHKQLYFKLYCLGEPASLSKSLPMLENMGVKVVSEHPYEIKKQGETKHFWIHDFSLEYADVNSLKIEDLKLRFQTAFEQCWAGNVENDGFNALVISANLTWRDVNIVRAFYFYLRQLGMTFSQSYVEETLINNAAAVKALIDLFYARFDSSHALAIEVSDFIEAAQSCIEQVKSLDEDRILRRYLNLILAAERTNFFQQTVDDLAIPYFAIKFKSERIDEMPSPVPFFEIFVYSSRFEGIHLRGGAVARGGLRWSDRREDFRTEVLGLMKAQMTKNAVIVPTGAKGGFVLKSAYQSSELAVEGLACYHTFIQGLLDITDNYQDDSIIKPEAIHCYDAVEDPYLVVAADKGTASFSDYANALSRKSNFWLDDAFASGGSAGYDHKVMGITAKGAWVSVEHHFDGLGFDIDNQPFTAVGIGDMAGDVFGNGLLLSKQVKLVAAFNHLSIFLDPNPDVALSFAERQRLFSLPRSNWNDYDNSLISQGGGIYSRKAKIIHLSEEVRVSLGIDDEKLSPNALIKAILSAPVDLLWNGGIGTYVKATDELDSDVGDRANDALRINGADLACKVVGEGGNLGFTQKGRIEYALQGGCINTDSIDNSAGVDCSDHEVNIKILLNSVLSKGDMTAKQRDVLLESMTDDVAALVLNNNYQQNSAISMIQHECLSVWPILQRLIHILEKRANLDRALEKLPNDKLMQARKASGQGLMRPEISVLLAYTKQFLKVALLSEFEVIDKPLFQHVLNDYFPEALQNQYAEEIQTHRLAKEIVANQLINSLVNRLGIVFPSHFMDELKCSAAELVNLYSLVCQLFDIDSLWSLQSELEGKIDDDSMAGIKLRIRKWIEHTMYWFASNEKDTQVLTHYANSINSLKTNLNSLLTATEKKQIDVEVDKLMLLGVDSNLALKIAQIDVLYASLNAIKVHKNSEYALDDVTKGLFYQAGFLQLDWLYTHILKLSKDNTWEALSKRAMVDEYNQLCYVLLDSVLSLDAANIQLKLELWQQDNEVLIQHYLGLIEEVVSHEVVSLEKIVVLLSACWKLTVYEK